MSQKKIEEEVAESDSDTKNEEEQKLVEHPKEMTMKEAYFASLYEWAKQAAIAQNALAMFPYYLLSNYPQMFQSQTTSSTLPHTQPVTPAASAGPNYQQTNQQRPQPPVQGGGAPAIRPDFNQFRLLDEAQQQEIIDRSGGYEYILAAFWKRVAAEAIDIFILFVMKIIVTFAVVNFFDLDVGIDINRDVMRKTLEEDDLFRNFFDIMDFVKLSSDLILIELLTKLIVCCYEAIWTVWYNGATPGKHLMKIRIYYVEAMVPLPIQVQRNAILQFIGPGEREIQRALLYPAETPTFLRAFMRAVVKNLVTTLLFPLFIVMLFFNINRTAYDIVTKTIVVETNANVVFRPQQQQRQQQ